MITFMHKPLYIKRPQVKTVPYCIHMITFMHKPLKYQKKKKKVKTVPYCNYSSRVETSTVHTPLLLSPFPACLAKHLFFGGHISTSSGHRWSPAPTIYFCGHIHVIGTSRNGNLRRSPGGTRTLMFLFLFLFLFCFHGRFQQGLK